MRVFDKNTEKNFSRAFKTFLDQPGFPLVRASVQDGRLVLHQERFKNYGTPTSASQLWQIPVTLKLEDGQGARTTTILLTKRRQTLDLPTAPQWFLLNAGASGYYRWSLPTGQLESLAAEDLTPLERLDLVSNAGALLRAGQVAGDAYLELLTQVAADANPTVLSALLDAFEMVEATFITAQAQDLYAAYLRRTLGPSLDRLGRRPQDGEDGTASEVRSRLFYLLGDAGHDQNIRRHARQVADAFLRGEVAPPGLLNPALKLAALDGDAELLKLYRENLEVAQPMHRRGLVEALVAFPNEASRLHLLDQFVAGEMELGEFFSVAFILGSDDATAPLVLRWMQTNYAGLAAKLPPFAMPFLPGMSAGSCSTEHLTTVEAFFRQPQHRPGGTENQVAQVVERIGDCASLRSREGPSVVRYLEQGQR